MKEPSRLKNLPLPLQLVLAGFSVFPVCASLFHCSPWSEPSLETPLVALFAFWIGPIVICYFSVKRHFYLIPLFFLECAGLLMYTLLPGIAGAEQIETLRYLLFVSMLLFSIVFFQRDSLYPLLAGNGRRWRRSPRLSLNLPVRLWYRDHRDAPLNVTLKNLSLSGLSLEGDTQAISGFLGKKNELSQFILYLGFEKREWMLTVKVVRQTLEGERTTVALESLDLRTTGKLLGEVSHKGFVTANWFARYWASEGFHHATLLACAVFAAVILINPSCSQSKGPAAKATAAGTKVWPHQE